METLFITLLCHILQILNIKRSRTFLHHLLLDFNWAYCVHDSVFVKVVSDVELSADQDHGDTKIHHEASVSPETSLEKIVIIF